MDLKDVESKQPKAQIVPAAQDATAEDSDQIQAVRLDPEEQGRFVELLLDPPESAPAMERARRVHAVMIRSR